MLNNDIMNQIEMAMLAGDLTILSKQSEELLHENEMYLSAVDIVYKNRLRDMELIYDLRERIDEMKNLVVKINEIEVEAIRLKDHSLMWKCENRKAKLISMMQYIHEKYML